MLETSLKGDFFTKVLTRNSLVAANLINKTRAITLLTQFVAKSNLIDIIIHGDIDK